MRKTTSVTSNKSHNSDNMEFKRSVVSFQIDRQLWKEFDEYVTERYGNYKKSILIESLIRKYLKQKKSLAERANMQSSSVDFM